MTNTRPRWWQRRRGPIGLLGINLVLVALVSSGVLAVLPDEVTSRGNNLESGGLPNVLEVTFPSTPGSQCDLDYRGPGGSGRVISSDPVDFFYEGGLIELSRGAELPPLRKLCFKNVSSEPIAVGVMISEESYRSFEVGDCLAQEVDRGDTTCGDGDQGELSIIGVHYERIVPSESTSTSCLQGNVAPQLRPGQSELIDRDLDPGETCSVEIYPIINPFATDDQLLRAATDRVEFTVVYDARDPVASP